VLCTTSDQLHRRRQTGTELKAVRTATSPIFQISCARKPTTGWQPVVLPDLTSRPALFSIAELQRAGGVQEQGARAIDPFTYKIVLAAAWIILGTLHGFGAAWLAIWMLFHPYQPIKLFGFTIWPQGMIPRHRDKLAQSIGKAVGGELVSQETVFNALFETDFFRGRVEGFVNAYADDLLSTVYPSFIDALPNVARAPVLDTIFSLQYRLAEYIAAMLKSEETAQAIERFVDRQVDDLLSRRLSDTVSDEAFDQVVQFVEERFHRLVTEAGLAATVREFINGRLDDLAHSGATLAETVTPETVAFLKERLGQQVPPIVHQLAEIASSQNTRRQIGALIKREVDEYYEQLSLIKKIFISRERINREVDELVNKTLPRRIEEYLRGPAFEQEAESFLNSTIDKVLSRPLNEIIGQLEPQKFETIKAQIADRILELAQSQELAASVARYVSDAIERLRPKTLGAMLEHLTPDSAARVKTFLTRGLLSLITREDTARTINGILNTQVERLLIAPIGRLGDHLPQQTVQRTTATLVERITLEARQRLPATIAEFDVGGLVQKKVAAYPLEKLEALILSVAGHHLKTIELFGAAIGFVIGVGQAIVTLISR
jgi:uncharacterized membrane protein YheB (UPF0754 family)